MRVIGTAGHVDHGKSTLVEALTGTHPDRLKEEREREMTIDLGFAWLTLPGGEEVGIVDVPGHRDFIENMLAGVGGIDAALFVVAADEGVMPQTREHLAILDLLQVGGGVVALTKVDMIEPEGSDDWLDLIESDLRASLSGTVLEGAEIVRVSARTRQGLAALLAALDACLAGRPPRPDLGRPRLPVDRIFTIPGFGTVVTGTLTDGRFQVGDEVEVLPQGLKGRVRGLQTHKQKEDTAVPGSRTAVNLAGVPLEAVERGNVVAHPGDYRPDRRLDVRFRLLADASSPLHHNTEVKLFIGAAEVLARLRLLGSDELLPGQEGWLQLELSQEVIAVRGDHYILRRPSPGETLGGGMVIDPHPQTRHKRFSADVLQGLEALARGTPGDVLLQALLGLGAAPLKDAVARANLPDAAANEALQELLDSRQVILLDRSSELPTGSPADYAALKNELAAARSTWMQITERTVQELESYHQQYPLRAGMPREELKSRLKNQLERSKGLPPARLFNLVLARLAGQGQLLENGPLVLRTGHSIHFSPEQERRCGQLLARFAAAPYAPPSLKECQAELGEDLVQALLDTSQLVQAGPEVLFRRQDYERMLAELDRLFAQHGSLSAGQVRDHFNTSRRYVLALLEHLDSQGVTIREGDTRRLRKPP